MCCEHCALWLCVCGVGAVPLLLSLLSPCSCLRDAHPTSLLYCTRTVVFLPLFSCTVAIAIRMSSNK